MSKNKALTVRPATLMDSVNITRLIRSSWRDTPATSIAEMDDNRTLEYVNTTLKHCFCLVAERDGRILGSVALVPIRIPWAAADVLCLAEGWLAVAGEHRLRPEVPRALLDAVDEFLDRTKHTALLGTTLLGPEASLAEVMQDRPGYAAARKSFIRVPQLLRSAVAK